MRIYLDNCCFNRPFDDQSQLRISIETQAKLFIQQEVLSGTYELLWSYALEYENGNNPFDQRKDNVLEWKDIAVDFIKESEDILLFSENLKSRGVKTLDSLHVACAYYGKCDYFITVDKKLLNKGINEIKMRNPIDFLEEMEA